MVAAQGGETRDADARTGGGVSGRFRLLGGSAEAPDTTPPPFGTAPWGYRRSEVDAWASWVAGLVAHGRNETVRADSAEATLKATLDRLKQLERASEPDASAEPAAAGPGTRTTGRFHFDSTAGLPRRIPRGTAAASAPETAADAAEAKASDTKAHDTGAAARPGTAAEGPPRDHDLARLHVVETTLHEVLGLLHQLADRDRRITGS